MKDIKRFMVAAGMAAVMATTTNPMAVKASIPPTSIEHNVEDEKDVIARTTADWKKLQEEYSTYYCNLDTDRIDALLEIEEFIEKNYNVYYNDTLSTNFTVDDVIAYRHDENAGFSFMKLVAAYQKLNKDDDKEVASFLKEYGTYLADIHAHNYFTLITILATIRNDVGWYVRQDLEAYLETEYGYKLNEVHQTKDSEGNTVEYVESKSTGGKISADLTTVNIHYPELEVVVDITAPNDNSDLTVFPENDVPDTKVNGRYFGDGFVDIQTTYLNVLKEVHYLGKHFTGNLEEKDKEFFLGYETYKNDGTTIDTNKEVDQVYSIEHNDKINDLIKDGVRVIKTLSPATTYDADEIYEHGYDVTALGYGHWYTEKPKKSRTTVKENGQTVEKDQINLVETLQCPTLSYEDIIKADPSLKLK